MHNRKTGYETYVTWADFLSLIGWFVLQDGVGWFHHSGDLWRNDSENLAQTSRNVGFLCLHVVLFSDFLVVLKFLVCVFPFVCCLTAMAILQIHTWTFEASTSCCRFVLFVLVFEKIASQELTLPKPYLVHLATVLGRLCYEGFFSFLFLTTIDRCFKGGIVAKA